MKSPLTTVNKRNWSASTRVNGRSIRRVMLAGAIGAFLGQMSLLAATWVEAVTASAPRYWYRFEENDPTFQWATNYGSANGWDGVYGPQITGLANRGKPSALSPLSNAIEFAGPEVGATTGNTWT